MILRPTSQIRHQHNDVNKVTVTVRGKEPGWIQTLKAIDTQVYKLDNLEAQVMRQV